MRCNIMTREDLLEIIYELIVVETDDDFLQLHSVNGNEITIIIRNNETFKITVNKFCG